MQNIKDMRGKTLLLIMNAERRLQTGEADETERRETGLIIRDKSAWIAEQITQ